MALHSMENPVVFELSEVVRQLLVNIRRQLQAAIDTYDLGISAHEAHLLVLLQQHKEQSPRELCQNTGFDKAVVTRLINHLLELELVTKKPSALDKRSVRLRLSDKGLKDAKLLLKARQQAHKQSFSALNSEELEVVTELLRKCI